MAATIRLSNGIEATIDNYKWTSDTPKIAEAFTNLLPPYPASSDPNPDLTAAQDIVKRLGGEVVRFDESKFVSGRIY